VAQEAAASVGRPLGGLVAPHGQDSPPDGVGQEADGDGDQQEPSHRLSADDFQRTSTVGLLAEVTEAHAQGQQPEQPVEQASRGQPEPRRPRQSILCHDAGGH
jgi:hypothetical protein